MQNTIISSVATVLFFLLISFCQSCKSTISDQIKTEKISPASYGCLEGNCVNGSGTFLWENGSKYTGEFKNGAMHGNGTFYFGGKSISPGSKYTGEFRNGFIHGSGTWTWTNGDKYIGECKYNKMHGKGIYYYSDGTIREGTWINDKYVTE